MSEHRRKLIEVALPLEAINTESAREKSIRHGHPSTLHLWWARRPLAACRAVLFAQLVDDPSSRPDEFPTEETQRKERDRLFGIIEELVKWENVSNERVLAAARAEIVKSCDGNPPPVLDPFAGGGSIPLEAQRLGLEAHASDLNPVAVLINKALIEIPPRWAGQPPVWPGATEETLTSDWSGAKGLADDVRRYGAWMRDQAEQRIGHLYPDATLPDGSTAKVIAWIWARTITCPNPACRATMPLISTYWLSKKKGRPTWLHPIVSGTRVRFEIRTGDSGPMDPPKIGRGAKFACVICESVADDEYVKSEGTSGRMGAQLLCTVAAASRGRTYLTPSETDTDSAAAARPSDTPDGDMPENPRWFSPPAFGMTSYADLFTNRQLVVLATFSDLVSEAHANVTKDAEDAGLSASHARSYADAVATFLGIATSRMADMNNSFATWSNSRDQAAHLFTRQAIPMVWDFVEVNPFAGAAGDPAVPEFGSRVISTLPASPAGTSEQANASDRVYPGASLISTDPPYYDNIGYSDVSDFFYVWLRRSLAAIANVTSTMLTPKIEELVATPYRFAGSRKRAKEHFESGFNATFQAIRASQDGTYPTTVFYAFKQGEVDDSGLASTGWETMLSGLIQSGFAITATWPMRERTGRMISVGTNSLASFVVISCRPREIEAPTVMRAGFVTALHSELPKALRDLQQGAIAPVDLPQAAIGPGMAIFSRYGRVLEADGSAMRVRTALALINQVLDEVLREQEGDFDPDTRWCVSWFEQHGFDTGKFGDADNLARARDTSVEGLQRAGVVTKGKGDVALIPFDGLDPTYDPMKDDRPTVWEVTMHAAGRLNSEGGEPAARFLKRAGSRVDLDAVKELGYLLYNICERKGWTESAIAFNGLVTSWLDLQDAMRTLPDEVQGALNFDEGA